MNEIELSNLRSAVKRFQNPSIGAQIAGVVGFPIEKAIALLPKKAMDAIGSVAQKAIHASLKLSLSTMNHHDLTSGIRPPTSSDWLHLAGTAATGAAGGFFGPLALAIEIPISTTIIMRSIADVARSEGADLQDIRIQLECVQILALGGGSMLDDAADIGYFVAREAMAKAVSEAAAHIAKNGLSQEAAPAIAKLIIGISERYAINITEKAAAQSIPIIGAVSGAVINSVFIDHFQSMARGHFAVRRLENKYGSEIVRAKYREFMQ